MMRTGLTFKQRELLDFIRLFVAETGSPPSYSEMMEAMDLKSKSSVHRLVFALEERGYLKRAPGKMRSIFLTEKRAYSFDLPPDLDSTLQHIATAASIPPQDIIVSALREYIMERPVA